MNNPANANSLPLVSVVLPACNHEAFVQDSIKSIICQNYRNIELHILDDGSRDATFTKISAMADLCRERFIHFSMQHQENCGKCTTLNRLLDKAQGKYVYFIASDDMAKCSAIKKLVEFLEANEDYCLAVGDNLFIGRDNQICYCDEQKRIVHNKSRAKWETYAPILMQDCSLDFSTEAFGSYAKLFKANHVPRGYMVRKTTLDTIGKIPSEVHSEIWYLMLQLSKLGKFRFFDTPLYMFRRHGTLALSDREKETLLCKHAQAHELKNWVMKLDCSSLAPDGKDFYASQDHRTRYRTPFVNFCRNTQLCVEEQHARQAREANETQEHYDKVLQDLQKQVASGGKIRIGFSVVYSQSWGGRGLFEECLHGNLFEPEIIIIPDTHRGEQNMAKVCAESFEELEKAYPGYVRLYIAGNECLKFEDLYDIIVLAMPYDAMTLNIYGLEYLKTKQCLTIYIDYSFTPYFPNAIKEYTNFTDRLWRYYTSSYYYCDQLKKLSMLTKRNIYSFGYTKIDRLSKAERLVNDKKTILITPHHTVGRAWEQNHYSLSNFLKYYKLFNELPQIFDNINFVFRPHPLLFITLINHNIWTEHEVNSYIDNMQSHKNVYYSNEADYFQIFINSDAIINDCSSFSIEYLYTRKPQLFLSKGYDIDINNFDGLALQCINHSYKANNSDDIINFINDVVINNNDYMKESRIDFLKKNLYMKFPRSSKFTLEHLQNAFKQIAR